MIAFLSVSMLAFPKDEKGKTFLVLFNKTELKQIQSSPEFIGLNFLGKYATKTYSGNSEAALFITLSFKEMTDCEIGELLVQVNPTTWMPLNEIAWRIIDLEESKENYLAILTEKGGRTTSASKGRLFKN